MNLEMVMRSEAEEWALALRSRLKRNSAKTSLCPDTGHLWLERPKQARPKEAPQLTFRENLEILNRE